MSKLHDRGEFPAKEVRRIIMVWLGLMILLGSTLSLSFVPLGIGNAVVSLIIAAAKVSLVAYFYMHLRSAHVYIRTAGLISVFIISLLFMFLTVDYVSRVAPSAPWQ